MKKITQEEFEQFKKDFKKDVDEKIESLKKELKRESEILDCLLSFLKVKVVEEDYIAEEKQDIFNNFDFGLDYFNWSILPSNKVIKQRYVIKKIK